MVLYSNILSIRGQNSDICYPTHITNNEDYRYLYDDFSKSQLNDK